MSRSKQAGSRVKALPWVMLARGATVLGKRWTALSGKERARLAGLLRGSRGRVGSLSSRERAELRRLVRKLDLKGAGRELVALRGAGRRRRKRR